jgi:hypothetical protein
MLRRKAISYWRSVPRQEFLVAISISIVLCSGLAAIDLFLPHVMKSAAIESAYRGNIEVADQIKITRGYYTQQIVAKALASNVFLR